MGPSYRGLAEKEPSEANETGPADESQNKASDQPVERTAKTGEGSLLAARSLSRTSGAGVILINGNMTEFSGGEVRKFKSFSQKMNRADLNSVVC